MPVLSEKPYVMPPGPIHSTNPTQILIVEDSATQAERLKYSLEQHGYHSSCRAQRSASLESMRAAAPRLVISDIVMPEMDGYELCRRIKTGSALQE